MKDDFLDALDRRREEEVQAQKRKNIINGLKGAGVCIAAGAILVAAFSGQEIDPVESENTQPVTEAAAMPVQES